MIALGIRFAPLALFGLFHKTRLHYPGIEFTTDDDKKAGLLLQAHKDNYREVFRALELMQKSVDAGRGRDASNDCTER